MTDHDDPGRIEEPRSEGVRIIGAQEAAEAAGRGGGAPPPRPRADRNR